MSLKGDLTGQYILIDHIMMDGDQVFDQLNNASVVKSASQIEEVRRDYSSMIRFTILKSYYGCRHKARAVEISEYIETELVDQC